MPTIRFPILLLICLMLIIGGAGYSVFNRIQQDETQKIRQNLAAIADLKASQITDWIKQKQNAAIAASRGSATSILAEQWMQRGGQDDSLKQQIFNRLKFISNQHSYGEMALLDVTGKPLLTTDNDLNYVSVDKSLIQQSMDRKQVSLGEMHWDARPDGTAYVSLPIAAPLIPSVGSEAAVGVLWIELDAYHFLFPLIQKWPTPSETAETLLVKRDGNDVLFLNELRHKKDKPFSFRIPADHPTVLAAHAVRGATGFVSGIDYRGEPVIGYIAQIPSTDWSIIAKVDEKEVYAPIRQLALNVALVSLLLLAVVSLSLFFWWRQRIAHYRAAYLEAELQQQLLSLQYQSLSRYANDIVLLLDETGKIVDANERAETVYGYTREKLLEKSIRHLRANDELESLEIQFEAVKNKETILFEGMHVRSDGSHFPVEVNCLSIRSEEGLFIQSIIRDISERKAGQERERRLTNMYRALSTTNEAIIHAESEAALFSMVCQTAIEYGGMILAWIGVPNEQHLFVPVARFGRAASYLGEITISKLGDEPSGQGPSGIAYREGRSVVANDYAKGEVTAPWAEKAQQYGICSASAYPIKRAGSPFAVLSVYSAHPHAFDAQIVKLLEEMAANIGYALDNFGRAAGRKHVEKALQESERRYRELFETMQESFFVIEAIADEKGDPVDWRYVETNPQLERYMQMSREELVGRTYSEVVLEPDPAWINMLGTVALTGKAISHEQYAPARGRWLQVHAYSPRPGQAAVLFTDITDRKQTEEELKLAAMVYRDNSEAMMVTDADGIIIAVNPAFEQITGYSSDEATGKNSRLLKSGHHDKNLYQRIWTELNITGRWKGELWNKKKNGELFAVQLTINTIRSEDGAPYRYVALLSDITEKKQSEDLIWSQANFDALTGLPNRRLFRDRLQHEIHNAHRSHLPVALMFLDLDGFKDVNDSLGHDMGDVLLKTAAERLSNCVRKTDMVARLGGDEFTVILTEVHDLDNVERVARHILRTLSEPIKLGDEVAYVSASIGITLYPNDGEDIEALLKNADQAMYAAKQAGKNRYNYFTTSMQEAVMQRVRLINDMRTALVHNQFEIVYQPIVELATGNILKAEALIRWQHPTKGLINPVDFISTAEDTGMISSFGDWVFHEAAKQAAIWREKFHPGFQISVNISPVQFRNNGIDSSVWFKHLSELGVPGQGIVVEITEGLLLDAHPKVIDQLLLLRDAGIEVALDDFGTGYSSLAYLKKFDIDYVKIDQTFVQNLETDSNDMVLCEAMIAMAHKLGIKVIAEGVESGRQHELLANGGCDFAQGYLFSRPMSPEIFGILLRRNPFSYQESFNI